MEKDQKEKKPNKFLRFTSIAMQMGCTIYLSNLLGIWIDVKTGNTEEIYMKILTLLGVFIAIYSVIRGVIKITKND